jgi:putative FmdB family regulatory protein
VPTYAYACSACDHVFDVRQSFSDEPLTTCPRCERESLRKVFSPVGVVFKGSGFYRNDSRAAAKAKGGASSGSKAEGNGADKAEKTAPGSAASDTGSSATAAATASPAGSGSSGGAAGS